MSPGPAYNWLAVAHSLAQILEHAAQYRAAQFSKTVLTTSTTTRPPAASYSPSAVQPSSLHQTTEDWLRQIAITPTPIPPESPVPVAAAAASVVAPASDLPLPRASPSPAQDTRSPTSPQSLPDPSPLAPLQTAEVIASTSYASTPSEPTAPQISPTFQDDAPELRDADLPAAKSPPPRHLESSRVPSSRIGRLFHYGGLAASLGYGVASEFLRRSGGSTDGQSSSLMMTEANVSRLVSKLTQMRGAALKVGQFLSIQDTHVLPPEVDRIFRRVQDSAHYMPNWQMERVLSDALGPDWCESFVTFEPIPFAAASIGQVHRAVLAASVSPTGQDERVAIKVQFPNIGKSVDSDLGYLKILLTAGQLLPKGLFLDRTIAAMKEELADECDYTREANFLREFGDNAHLGADRKFKVPWVWDKSTSTVLVMEHVDGVSVGGDVVNRLSQQDKDDIASRIIELCLKELFVFRAMQTDPNWTNFLWNPSTRQIELVDFGATRVYTRTFMDNWLRLLRAAASGDFEACREASLRLGYLTGKENDAMLRAHITSMELLATPFRADTLQPFAFGPGTRWTEITAEIREQIPIMLEHRLTPPPRETYSLNRKLSGAFLLASRLEAKVDCRALWEEITSNYQFESPTSPAA